MNAVQALKWKRVREKGLTRYILVTGVLFFGGWMVIWNSAFQYWINPKAFRIVQIYETNIPIFAIGGLLLGVMFWALANRNYAAFQANENKAEQGADGDAEESV